FIPIFEKNGFIEKLDLYMFEKLCMQMREFEREGIYNNVRISINQSRILILNPDYAKNIEKMIQRYDVPVENIEIEITETVFLDEKEQVIEIINRLKEFGVILAMDDFGSGYSSLNILKDVPFDVLKIDREFFSETNTSLTSVLILEKIIEMAKAMGISVVCEGVETAEQVDILRDIGCDLVQGYFYGRPMPIEDFYERYCRVEE
ncbi:MAG: EAL domain-containing protein, partial [Lachnospiraceae bacterium]|nr:EAL domain-containing protein [Lachnospiraceae bacterium]